MSNYKTLDGINCPHCKKTIFLGLSSGITNVSTEEELIDAKKRILEEVEKLKFKTEEHKQNVIAMISSEDFNRSPEDIDETIKQIGLDICNS